MHGDDPGPRLVLTMSRSFCILSLICMQSIEREMKEEAVCEGDHRGRKEKKKKKRFQTGRQKSHSKIE
jgi:hypothetical protein